MALQKNLLDDAEIAFRVACRLNANCAKAYAGFANPEREAARRAISEEERKLLREFVLKRTEELASGKTSQAEKPWKVVKLTPA